MILTTLATCCEYNLFGWVSLVQIKAFMLYFENMAKRKTSLQMYHVLLYVIVTAVYIYVMYFAV